MTAFHPVVPFKAIEFVEAAGIPDARRIVRDFAAAGLLKSYALSIRTVGADGRSSEIRGATVPVDLWHRIVREGAVEDVWTGGTVWLQADEARGIPEVWITSISFGEKYLHRLVEQLRGTDPKRKLSRNETPLAAGAIDPPACAAAEPKKKQADLSAIPPGTLTVSVKQAQAALGLGRTKINELMNDGRLVRTNIDRAVRIDVGSIRALVGANNRT